MFLADAVVETHDRVVGRTYREADRICEAQLGNETAAVRESLRAFAELARVLTGARDTGEALDGVIADRPGSDGLGDLVDATRFTEALTHLRTGKALPLPHRSAQRAARPGINPGLRKMAEATAYHESDLGPRRALHRQPQLHQERLRGLRDGRHAVLRGVPRRAPKVAVRAGWSTRPR